MRTPDPVWRRGGSECGVTAWRVWCGWGQHHTLAFAEERNVPHDAFLEGDLHAEIARELGGDVLAEVLAVVRDAEGRPAFQEVWADDRATAERWRALPVDAGLLRWAPHDETTSRIWALHEHDAARAIGVVLERGDWRELRRFATAGFDDAPAGVLADDAGLWIRGENLRLARLTLEGAREATSDALVQFGFGAGVQAWRLARVEDRVLAAYWAHALDARSALRGVIGSRGLVEIAPRRGCIARSPSD